MLRLQGAKLREMAMAARCPSAADKDLPASRPAPRHPHLAGDLHQVPSNARATLGPRPAALQPERFSRLAPKVERSSLPRASLAPANQQADPASFSLPSFLLPPPAWPPSHARRWRTQMDKVV